MLFRILTYLHLNLGIHSGLLFYMTVHLLAEEDVKVGYGITITLGGFALVAGLPIAGLLLIQN